MAKLSILFSILVVIIVVFIVLLTQLYSFLIVLICTQHHMAQSMALLSCATRSSFSRKRRLEFVNRKDRKQRAM